MFRNRISRAMSMTSFPARLNSGCEFRIRAATRDFSRTADGISRPLCATDPTPCSTQITCHDTFSPTAIPLQAAEKVELRARAAGDTSSRAATDAPLCPI